MGVSGDRWPARSSAAGISSRRAEVFWHSRETERGGDAAGGKYGRRVRERRKRRRANVVYDRNSFKPYYCLFLSVNLVSVATENYMV